VPMSLAWIALTLLTQTPIPEAKAEISYEPNLPADGGTSQAEITYEPHFPDAGTDSVLEDSDPAYSVSDDSADAGTPDDAAAEKPSLLATPETDPAKAARGRSLFRGAVELAAQTLPSGTPAGLQDLFLHVTPIISVDTGDNFGFELGAGLRLRVIDGEPAQRDRDYAGLLRGADWDEFSDYGQVLRDLWLGADEAPVRLRAGPLRRVSLGRGLLVSRYSNQLNPDYHPLGAVVTLDAGPVHAQLLASDVLAGRLFALEVTGDIGELIGATAERGKYHATLSAGHDFGRAGGVTEPISLLMLEADAALYQGESVRSFAYGAIGSRLLTEDFGMGATLGVSADAELGSALLGFKLEGRKVGAGFRFGMFGPDHELARFSDLGLTQQGLSQARLPDGFSGFTEAQLELGHSAELSTSRRGALVLSASAEYFSFNRLDLDAAVTTRLPGDLATLTARFAMTGFNQVPRYDGAAEARYRFAPSFYALAHGGVTFFPQPDHTLVRGFFGGVGVGADFSH